MANRAIIPSTIKNGVKATNEYTDGHKTVDIAIPDSTIFIEVDRLHHPTDPKQILRDFKRDHYSDGDDFHAIHIPNQIIEEYLEEIAKAITDIVFDKEKMN